MDIRIIWYAEGGKMIFLLDARQRHPETIPKQQGGTPANGVPPILNRTVWRWLETPPSVFSECAPPMFLKSIDFTHIL